MDLAVERVDGILVVQATDRIDGTNASAFEQALSGELKAEDRGLVISMHNLVYISSAGLRAILMTAKMLRRSSSKLAICALQNPIREVFEISGFDKIIPIYDDKQEALAAL